MTQVKFLSYQISQIWLRSSHELLVPNDIHPFIGSIIEGLPYIVLDLVPVDIQE